MQDSQVKVNDRGCQDDSSDVDAVKRRSSHAFHGASNQLASSMVPPLCFGVNQLRYWVFRVFLRAAGTGIWSELKLCR
jgi:hypothetical protein